MQRTRQIKQNMVSCIQTIKQARSTEWTAIHNVAHHIDVTSPYTNTQVVIPNNATNKVEVLPTGVASFYNPTNQKYLLSDNNGFYSVRVRFKVASSSQQTFLNLSIS